MKVTYKQIRDAVKDLKTVDLEFAAADAVRAVQAVNLGIDSCLEACFVRERGDDYFWRNPGFLACRVSPKSLPTLLRRLRAQSDDLSLIEAIFDALGISRLECGDIEIIPPYDELARDHYPDGLCPECQHPIDETEEGEDAHHGDDCENCGSTFSWETGEEDSALTLMQGGSGERVSKIQVV